jgi:hypothetical protein
MLKKYSCGPPADPPACHTYIIGRNNTVKISAAAGTIHLYRISFFFEAVETTAVIRHTSEITVLNTRNTVFVLNIPRSSSSRTIPCAIPLEKIIINNTAKRIR